MKNQTSSQNLLPLNRDQTPEVIASMIIAVLMTAASIIGLVNPAIYSTDALYEYFYVNDAINLIIGLPILLGSIWTARRGSLLGLLFWPGALAFILYNYIIYLIAMPLNLLYLMYPILVILSAFALFRLIRTLDGDILKARLGGIARERFSGGILTGFGVLFLLRAIFELVAMFSSGEFPITEMGLNIADIVLAALWIIGGVSLWRRRALGYKTGLGLLVQGCALFVGLIILLFLNAYFAGDPFPMVDILVVAVMSLIFFIPFGLFARGVRASN